MKDIFGKDLNDLVLLSQTGAINMFLPKEAIILSVAANVRAL